MKIQTHKMVTFPLLLLLSASSQAQWILDSGASSFFFVTNKAAAVSEVNSFTGVSGSITEAGSATLVLELSTVDTAVEIRNQRLAEMLFQVGNFPMATVTLIVDTAALESMPAGLTATGSYTAIVDLHGIKQDVVADMQIVKLDAETLQVQLARPLIVNAASFGLAEGVEALRAVASLPSITPNVVVDFTLVYHKE
jgi:polyisoprenoid-binding protein YceI